MTNGLWIFLGLIIVAIVIHVAIKQLCKTIQEFLNKK